MVGFLRRFRALGFVECEDRFRRVDQGNYLQHPCDASDRPGARSGARSWPDSSTFLVSMVVAFFVSISDFQIPSVWRNIAVDTV